MTTLLALDTATEACTCALYHDGEIRLREHLAPRRHGELILPDCQRLLEEAGIGPQRLDAIAFGRGPGAFTGLRIAAGVTQGIALAHDHPVIPLSTLATLAAGAHRRLGAEYVLVTQDARMDEVYWCAYRIGEGGLPQALCEERLSAPESVTLPDHPGPWQAVGSGWAAYPDALSQATGIAPDRARPHWYPSAQDMIPAALAALARGALLPAEGAQPVYLRNQVTTPAR